MTWNDTQVPSIVRIVLGQAKYKINNRLQLEALIRNALMATGDYSKLYW